MSRRPTAGEEIDIGTNKALALQPPTFSIHSQPRRLLEQLHTGPAHPTKQGSRLASQCATLFTSGPTKIQQEMLDKHLAIAGGYQVGASEEEAKKAMQIECDREEIFALDPAALTPPRPPSVIGAALKDAEDAARGVINFAENAFKSAKDAATSAFNIFEMILPVALVIGGIVVFKTIQ